MDTECSFSSKGVCSYYSSKQVRKQAGKDAQKVWRRHHCPVVYVKTDEKYRAFCPTRGGPLGERLPTLSVPGANSVKVQLQITGEMSWEEIIEKAAKTACGIGC